MSSEKRIDGRKVRKVLRLFGNDNRLPVYGNPVLLKTGAKLYKMEDGYYYILGYYWDDSDVTTILSQI